MKCEISKDELIALIKGLSGYESYQKANELNSMGAGELYGFPNERWKWNDSFFINKNEEQLYSFYKLLKSWVK